MILRASAKHPESVLRSRSIVERKNYCTRYTPLVTRNLKLQLGTTTVVSEQTVGGWLCDPGRLHGQDLGRGDVANLVCLRKTGHFWHRIEQLRV